MSSITDNFLDLESNQVYIIEGDRGTGKNLLAMDVILQALNELKDIHIYSNFPLQNIPDDKWTKISYFRLLRDWTNFKKPCLLILDEIHVMADSRDFNNKDTYKEYTKLFTQLRKRHMTVLGMTQDIMMLEIRIRNQTNYLIKSVVTKEFEEIQTSQGTVIKKVEYYNYLLNRKIGKNCFRVVKDPIKTSFNLIKKGNYYDTDYIIEFYDELDKLEETKEE